MPKLTDKLITMASLICMHMMVTPLEQQDPSRYCMMFTRKTAIHTNTGQYSTSDCTLYQRWSTQWRKEWVRDTQSEIVWDKECVWERDILRQIMLFDKEHEQGVDEIEHCWLTLNIMPASHPLACLYSRALMFQFLKCFSTEGFRLTRLAWMLLHRLCYPALFNTHPWLLSRDSLKYLAMKRNKAASPVAGTITGNLRRKITFRLSQKKNVTLFK